MAELDEKTIALRVTEPMLTARIERVQRQLLSEFKGGKLTQETVIKLHAEYQAARGLLGVLNEMAGGSQNG